MMKLTRQQKVQAVVDALRYMTTRTTDFSAKNIRCYVDAPMNVHEVAWVMKHETEAIEALLGRKLVYLPASYRETSRGQRIPLDEAQLKVA